MAWLILLSIRIRSVVSKAFKIPTQTWSKCNNGLALVPGILYHRASVNPLKDGWVMIKSFLYTRHSSRWRRCYRVRSLLLVSSTWSNSLIHRDNITSAKLPHLSLTSRGSCHNFPMTPLWPGYSQLGSYQCHQSNVLGGLWWRIWGTPGDQLRTGSGHEGATVLLPGFAIKW